jgi:cysteine desulfurase
MNLGAYPFRVPDLTYLDHAASTPMRPEAVEAMLPYLTEHFGNPSGSHRAARDARKAIDESRELVASLLGVDSSEVVFTGDGTEADNLAVLGVPAARGGVAVCSAVEHHAVLHPVEHLGGRIVAVDAAGAIDLDALAAALDDEVSVVSVMTVNNEVGTVQPIAQVAELVAERAPNAVLHTDAIQAFAWLDVAEVCAGAHLLSISGHKFGGPKGVGVLAVRKGVEIEPLVLGGGQERGRRSGTQNVAGIVALATAMSLAHDERKSMVDRVSALRDRLVDGLMSQIGGLTETVARHRKVAGNAHVLVEGVESEALLFLLDREGVCASAGSSCSSGAMDPSHVLAAMGVPRAQAAYAVRLSLGPASTSADVDRALEIIPAAITKLRR